MNIKFIVEYNGTNYHGWQIQKELPTIQGELSNAFSILFPNHKINIIGSGRTDTGVHAYNQVASIQIPKTDNLNKVFNSINGIINNDIYIKNYIEVNSDFNARFSARYRTYKYYIKKKYSPFSKNIPWRVFCTPGARSYTTVLPCGYICSSLRVPSTPHMITDIIIFVVLPG